MLTITVSAREIFLIAILFIISWAIGSFLAGFLGECGKDYKELRIQKLWEKKIKKK